MCLEQEQQDHEPRSKNANLEIFFTKIWVTEEIIVPSPVFCQTPQSSSNLGHHRAHRSSASNSSSNQTRTTQIFLFCQY